MRARLFVPLIIQKAITCPGNASETIEAVGGAVLHEVVAGVAGVVVRCKLVPNLACRAHFVARVLEAIGAICVGGAVDHVVAGGAGVVARCKEVVALACHARLFARVLEAIEAVGGAVVHVVVADSARVVARCEIVPGPAFRARLFVRELEALGAVGVAVDHVVAFIACVIRCKIETEQAPDACLIIRTKKTFGKRKGTATHVLAFGAGVTVSKIKAGLACRARLGVCVREAIELMGGAIDHEAVAGDAGLVVREVEPGLANSAQNTLFGYWAYIPCCEVDILLYLARDGRGSAGRRDGRGAEFKGKGGVFCFFTHALV